MTVKSAVRRQEHVVRVLKLMRLLEEGSRFWTWYDLAERFNVSVRTVHRDVAALRAAGASVSITRDGLTNDYAHLHRLSWPVEQGATAE